MSALLTAAVLHVTLPSLPIHLTAIPSLSPPGTIAGLHLFIINPSSDFEPSNYSYSSSSTSTSTINTQDPAPSQPRHIEEVTPKSGTSATSYSPLFPRSHPFHQSRTRSSDSSLEVRKPIPQPLTKVGGAQEMYDFPLSLSIASSGSIDLPTHNRFYLSHNYI